MELLISQEMPVAPDTKKAKVQISNCVQGLPVPSRFCSGAFIAFLCHLMLTPQAAPSLPAAVEALHSLPFLPRNVSVALGLILIPQGDPLRGPLCNPHFEGALYRVPVATEAVKWAGPAGILGAIVSALILMVSHSLKIPWRQVCLNFWHLMAGPKSCHHLTLFHPEEEGKTLRDSGPCKG